MKPEAVWETLGFRHLFWFSDYCLYHFVILLFHQSAQDGPRGQSWSDREPDGTDFELACFCFELDQVGTSADQGRDGSPRAVSAEVRFPD